MREMLLALGVLAIGCPPAFAGKAAPPPGPPGGRVEVFASAKAHEMKLGVVLAPGRAGESTLAESWNVMPGGIVEASGLAARELTSFRNHLVQTLPRSADHHFDAATGTFGRRWTDCSNHPGAIPAGGEPCRVGERQGFMFTLPPPKPAYLPQMASSREAN